MNKHTEQNEQLMKKLIDSELQIMRCRFKILELTEQIIENNKQNIKTFEDYNNLAKIVKSLKPYYPQVYERWKANNKAIYDRLYHKR